MNHTIKTPNALAIIAVLFLGSISLINWGNKEIEKIVQYVPIESQLQVAQISGAGSGLQLHWTFDDGTAADSVGSNTGSIIGGASAVSGKISGALSFDGSDDIASLSSNTSFNFTASDSFTVSAWVKTAPGYNQTRAIAGKMSSFNHGGWSILNLNSATSYLYGRLQDTSGNNTGYVANGAFPGTQFINDGNWHHVAMVIDRGAQRMYLYTDTYIRNSAGTDISSIGDLSNTVGAFRVGQGFSGYLTGSVDDVRIYNRALSSSEIGELYALGSSPTPPPPAQTPTPEPTPEPTPTQEPPVTEQPTTHTLVAGADQTITLPATASLSATFDGASSLPANSLVSGGWSKVSGPGNVTFSGGILSATASFSQAGVYVLQVSAIDTYLSLSDQVTVTVNPAISDTVAPTVTSMGTSNITQTSATIYWQTNELSSTQIEYGLTSSLGNTTSFNSSLVTSHSQTINNLTPNTIYNYQVISRDAAGNIARSTTQTFTTASDQPVVVQGSKNIVENGSFETGLNHDWSFSAYDYATPEPLLESKYLDKTVAYDGKHSLKIVFDGRSVFSTIYRLKPNTLYTISFYAKSGSALNLESSIQNTFTAPVGPGDIHKMPYTRVDTQWQRYSYSFTTTADAAHSSYFLRMRSYNVSYPNVPLWIDAVQIEEGNLTAYKPRADVETGLAIDSSRTGNLFFEDEPITFTLRTANGTDTAKNAVVKYELYNYYNQLAKSGSINVNNIPAHGVIEQSVDITLSAGKRGSFRAIAWVEGLDGTRDEITFGVLPRPRTLGKDEASLIGADVPMRAYHMSALQKAGVKWSRVFSTAKTFAWRHVETSDNVYKWADAEVDMAHSYGFTLLANFFSAGSLPDWALDSSGLPDANKLGDYVYDLVNHFKVKGVKYWEVFNEPDTEGSAALSKTNDSVGVYANLLKVAYTKIKEADPNAKVVGIVAFNPSFINGVISKIGTGYFDYASSHIYPGGEYGAKRVVDIYDSHSKEVWNDETGSMVKMFSQVPLWEDMYVYHTYNRPDTGGGDYRDRVDRLVRNFSKTIGLGFDKYFYYDARDTVALNFPIATSLFDWDQSLKPTGVAYSIIANMLDHSVGKGELRTATSPLFPEVRAFTFLRDGTVPVVVMWTSADEDWRNTDKVINDKAKIVRTTLPDSVRAYDTMGNPISLSNGASFGASPIYLVGTGITLAQLSSSLSVQSSSDTTAPYLSMVTYPLGPTNGERVLFRWFAIDNLLRTFGSNPSMSYSYQLEGRDTSWSSWGSNVSVTYSGLANGTYTFRVKARDVAGNESMVTCGPVTIGSSGNPTVCSGMSLANPITITQPTAPTQPLPEQPTTPTTPTTPTSNPDRTAPTVFITAPSSGSSVTSASSVVVSASASDQSVSGEDTSGVAGVQFKINSQNLGVEDIVAPYSVTWNASTLPDGNYSITAVARDVAGNTRTSSPVTVTITTPVVVNTPPVLATISNRTVGEGSSLSITASATDADGDTLAYSVTNVPSGASWNASTRTLSWTPGYSHSGTYGGIAFSVSDGRGGTDSETISITVTNTNRPPIANAGNDQSVTLPATINLSGSGSSDPDGSTLTYSWSRVSGPSGYTLSTSPSPVTPTATFTTAGTYVFRLSVSDGSLSDTDDVTVTVASAPVVVTDSDGDGVPDASDKCPNTLPGLVSTVNSLGCPKPKSTKFTTQTDLTNVDLNDVSSYEVGTVYGKITYEDTGETYSLVRDGSQLDLDTYISITQGRIELKSASLPELNKPATLTFYNVSVPKPLLLKDGALCSGCEIVSYENNTLVFTVPGFSIFEIVSDTIAPTVSIISPTAGATVSGNVSISANAEDGYGVDHVSFWANGTKINGEDETNPYSVTWDSSSFADGAYTLVAVANDAAGNISTSSPISVTLTNTVASPAPASGGSSGSGGGGGGGGGGGVLFSSSRKVVTVSNTGATPISTAINPALIQAIVNAQATSNQTSTQPGFSFTRYLTVGTINQDVKVLQQTLNSLGYVVAPAGVGSPGQETTYYGPLTTRAIEKFQCAVLQICSGSPTTNGYGNFGPATRTALNQRLGNQTTNTQVPSVQATNQQTTTSFTPVSGVLTKWLVIDTFDPEVLVLQRLLNTKGYTVSTSGPGSPGQETSYFGPATLQALQKFQCATLDICSGSIDSNGYGGVGPRTRGELGK